MKINQILTWSVLLWFLTLCINIKWFNQEKLKLLSFQKREICIIQEIKGNNFRKVHVVKFKNQASSQHGYYGSRACVSISNDLFKRILNYCTETKCVTYICKDTQTGQQTWFTFNAPWCLADKAFKLEAKTNRTLFSCGHPNGHQHTELRT